MGKSVCLQVVNSLAYLRGGGHLWVFLNWALGLQSLGYRVIWMDEVPPGLEAEEILTRVNILKGYLEPFGLSESLAIYEPKSHTFPPGIDDQCLDLEAASEADLLLNMRYGTPTEVVSRFRRSALVDIDPGLLQVWTNAKQIVLAEHDIYFTIGETVGQPEAVFPHCGIHWHYTPPPVFLPAWPVTKAKPDAPYTTVSGWWGEYLVFNGETFDNSKRASFLEYLQLPSQIKARLELALCLGESDLHEQRLLESHGWAIRNAWNEIPTPDDFRAYVQSSRGEFSCAKASCMRLQNAWVSDRTLNYLASGKPVVVQHTGPSRILPDAQGMFRFRTPEEACQALEVIESDYGGQCAQARRLAEEHFDAEAVIARVLERALD